MAQYNKNGWLDAAVSHVRFRPDRKAIRAELAAHMEDAEEALLASGMNASAAARRAVEIMGDADEVGRALDKVHSPWLGRLWLITRAALAVLCLVLAVFLIIGKAGPLFQKYPLAAAEPASFYDGFLPEIGEASDLSSQAQEIKTNGYTFDITGAWFFETDGEYAFVADITVTNPRPWAQPPLMLGLVALSCDGGEIASPLDIGIAMADGSLLTGDIFQTDLLEAERRWGAWHFTLRAEGLESCRHLELSYPLDHDLAWNFTPGRA